MEKTLFLQLFCVAKHTTKRSGGPFLVKSILTENKVGIDTVTFSWK